MIENSISELFNSIESSPEYQEYQKIKEILESDQEVLSLVDEIIKLLISGAASLDKEIEQKVKKLNEMPAYIKYLQAMEDFNQVLKMSSSLISNYVDDIVK